MNDKSITFYAPGKIYTFATIQRASKTMRRTTEQVLALINGDEVSTMWTYKPF